MIENKRKEISKVPSDQELDWLRDDLVSWYQVNGRAFPWRQNSTSLYKHVITEILLQHTKAEKVSLIYEPFFRSFPNWNALADSNVSVLQDVIRPLGLWRRRADFLHDLASTVSHNQGELPNSYPHLRQLPGIGQYVANAILLFQGRSREPLLDRGMARVVSRFFDLNVHADPCKDRNLREVAGRIVDCEDSIEISWALLDLSALICKARDPICANCPLDDRCRSKKLYIAH